MRVSVPITDNQMVLALFPTIISCNAILDSGDSRMYLSVSPEKLQSRKYGEVWFYENFCLSLPLLLPSYEEVI